MDRHEPEFLAEWDGVITPIEHDAGAKPFPQEIAQGLQGRKVRGRHGGARFDFDASHPAVGLFQHHIHFRTAAGANTIHNFGDAAIAIPLWIAFLAVRKIPTNRFTYGYGRVEDVAGITVVLAIFISGLVVGYESLSRFSSPQPIQHLWAVILASVVGFCGNEAVAVFRIKIGKEIGSAALIAEGHHARTDGLGSLAVLIGALGVWSGFPLADPLIGFVITLFIFKIEWESGKSLFARLLDSVDPDVVEEIGHAAQHVPGAEGITEIRVRWIGHRLLAEVNIAIASELTVEQGHDIAKEVRHQLLHHLQYLANATIHVDPLGASGECHHRVSAHAHDELPTHSY